MSAPQADTRPRAPRLANPRRFAALLVILMAAVIGLLFWARPLIRELIVLPLSYLFWAVGVFFRNAPERFFWAALMIVAGLAAWRSLLKPAMPLADLPPEVFEGAYQRPFRGQVSLWHLRVDSLRRSDSAYLRSTFEQSVGKLLFDTLSHRYHMSQGEVERRLRESSLDVPEPVRAYALDSLRRMHTIQPTGFKAYLLGLARQARNGIRGLLGAIPGARRLDATVNNPILAAEYERLDFVLSYMEKDLEVPDDDAGQ